MTGYRGVKARYIFGKELTGFDDRIKKEIATNGESTVWSDRREKLKSCIARKKNDMWEKKYAEFDNYDGMPESSSTLYIWQRDQLTGFDGEIKKEVATNKGSTVWSVRREKLETCILRKKNDVGEEVCRVR